MIMDTLGALALATEPPNDGLMKRAPVGRGASFITKTMWRNIFGQSIYQLVILAVLQFDGKRLLRLRGPDATEIVNTVIFNTFVFCQVRCCLIKPPLLSLYILLSILKVFSFTAVHIFSAHLSIGYKMINRPL
jgi:Ca2+-transporting ATPase